MRTTMPPTTILPCLLLLLMLPGCRTTGGRPGGGGGPAPTTAPTDAFGRFDGRVVAHWSDDGRNMTLEEDFAYLDPRGRRWDAPAGSVVNGASIPQTFWSLIGGPFEGPYRNASVVHDVACDRMAAPWEDVHLMFYEACLCGGVDERRAKLMYWAVYQFGPRWEAPPAETRPTDGGGGVETARNARRRVAPASPPPDAALARQAEQYFKQENPPLERVRVTRLRRSTSRPTATTPVPPAVPVPETAPTTAP